MAKSKIIKEIANSTIDTITALKRTKVLLSELENEEIKKWIDYEITGYPEEVELPEYRKTIGVLFGSYFKGSMASHMTWKNVSIPLGNMPDEMRKALLSVDFREGIEALKHLDMEQKGKDNSFGKIIPADVFPIIAKYNNDPYMIITSAKVVVGMQNVSSVFAAVENRLLDILMLLEKEFGILDELDIDTSQKSSDELDKITDGIYCIIYNDHSVRIGDSNKIHESTIGGYQ